MGDRNVTRTRLRSGNARDRRSEESRLSEAPERVPSTAADDAEVLDRDLVCEHIRLAIVGLRDVTCVVITAVEALRHQGADLDEEFALVLQRHASDRLHAEIEQLEVLVSVLDPRAAEDILGTAGERDDEKEPALAA